MGASSFTPSLMPLSISEPTSFAPVAFSFFRLLINHAILVLGLPQLVLAVQCFPCRLVCFQLRLVLFLDLLGHGLLRAGGAFFLAGGCRFFIPVIVRVLLYICVKVFGSQSGLSAKTLPQLFRAIDNIRHSILDARYLRYLHTAHRTVNGILNFIGCAWEPRFDLADKPIVQPLSKVSATGFGAFLRLLYSFLCGSLHRLIHFTGLRLDGGHAGVHIRRISADDPCRCAGCICCISHGRFAVQHGSGHILGNVLHFTGLGRQRNQPVCVLFHSNTHGTGFIGGFSYAFRKILACLICSRYCICAVFELLFVFFNGNGFKPPCLTDSVFDATTKDVIDFIYKSTECSARFSGSAIHIYSKHVERIPAFERVCRGSDPCFDKVCQRMIIKPCRNIVPDQIEAALHSCIRNTGKPRQIINDCFREGHSQHKQCLCKWFCARNDYITDSGNEHKAIHIRSPIAAKMATAPAVIIKALAIPLMASTNPPIFAR